MLVLCGLASRAAALGEDEAEDLAVEAEKEELVEERDEARARVRHAAARERVAHLRKTESTLLEASNRAKKNVEAAAEREKLAKAGLEAARGTDAALELTRQAAEAAAAHEEAQALAALLRTELVKTRDELEEARKRERRAETERRAAERRAKAARNLATQAAAARSEERDACDATSADSDFCLFGGGFVASASATLMSAEGLHGQSAHRLVSLLVPFGGARWAPGHTVSVDAGLLTGLLSKELVAAPKNTACRVASTTFEQLLPCEGNAVLRPYAAFFIGPSLGNKDVIWLSGYLTAGFARTSTDPTANFFWGFMIGTAGLQKVLSL